VTLCLRNEESILFVKLGKNPEFQKVYKTGISKANKYLVMYVKTWESANVYRADDYSEENPFYIVKGMDKSGNEYEQMVDVSKVNPNSCSYMELLALNAHTGNKSDSNFLSMAIMKDKSGTAYYHETADYMAMAHELMNDMKTLGNWDGYLRYGKWINDILTFCKSKS